jgi:hypothetical protein
METYTEAILIEQYNIHVRYVNSRKILKNQKLKIRLPALPEDISENIIKFILRKFGDPTSSRECRRGDLLSAQEGRQECKSFTSNGPTSFTPSSNWEVIYFLDARAWACNMFSLYRVSLSRTSDEWKNIKVSKAETFHDQCKQGRRPRITWNLLYPQISKFCTKMFEGSLEDIIC